jgi:hypothetical protein
MPDKHPRRDSDGQLPNRPRAELLVISSYQVKPNLAATSSVGMIFAPAFTAASDCPHEGFELIHRQIGNGCISHYSPSV